MKKSMLMIAAAALVLASSCTKDKSSNSTTSDPAYCYHCTAITVLWQRVPGVGYNKPIYDTVALDTCGITMVVRERLTISQQSYPTDSTRITRSVYCNHKY